MKTKFCLHCAEEFDVSREFYSKNHSAKDGFNNVCKSCDNKRRNKQRGIYAQDFSESWVDSKDQACPLILPIRLNTKETMSRADMFGAKGPLVVYACMIWGSDVDEEGKRFPTRRHSVWIDHDDALITQERLNK